MPLGGSGMPIVEDPVNDLERLGVAQVCMTKLELESIPSVIDGIDDAVNTAYAAWPDRLYLVGTDGTITYKGGPGPFGFKPDELEEAILREVDAEP